MLVFESHVVVEALMKIAKCINNYSVFTLLPCGEVEFNTYFEPDIIKGTPYRDITRGRGFVA